LVVRSWPQSIRGDPGLREERNARKEHDRGLFPRGIRSSERYMILKDRGRRGGTRDNLGAARGESKQKLNHSQKITKQQTGGRGGKKEYIFPSCRHHVFQCGEVGEEGTSNIKSRDWGDQSRMVRQAENMAQDSDRGGGIVKEGVKGGGGERL